MYRVYWEYNVLFVKKYYLNEILLVDVLFIGEGSLLGIINMICM